MADNGVREFGNTEFTADLEEYLSKDPIARLGFDPDSIRYDPKIGKNAFVTQSGKVVYGPELGSSKAVIMHEFRHKGLNKLREMIENDVGSFEGKYSQEALLELLKTDKKEQERLTEIFDHLDSNYITPRGESDNLLWSLDTISPEENFDREVDPEKRKLYNEIYKIAEDQVKGYNKGGLVTNSFYDMTPKELDLYIKEGGYDENKAEFLRNEWSKKNTLSGKAKSSIEDATQLPEGFDRADFLPVSKPEGKSVIDALKSGEADWALPGALVDTADEVLTAGRTGEKMTAGLPVSEDEQMQAAFTGAGAIMSGSSLTKAPKGSIRMSAAGDDKVVDIKTLQENKKIKDFYNKFSEDLKDRVNTLSEVTSKAREDGVFTGVNVGDRFLFSTGPAEIKNTFLRKVNPESKMFKQTFDRFGVEPELIEFKGNSYVPMVRYHQKGVEAEDFQEGDAYLQLIRLQGYKKMGINKNFAEGGLVTMDEQMSMFDVKGFAEGGMATDPVSGNEIPPGSSAEEVRDDIDAKLSEGEYVVPADVVQYYGVKFFEKLREKAKADLEEMASDGRIGGEPIEDDEEDDDEELSPEEMAMLQEVMSQGGEAPVEMAEGGLVDPMNILGSTKDKTNKKGFNRLVPKADKNMQPSFDPTKWATIGSSLFNNGTSQAGSIYKTFVGPSGEVRMILFVNGQPTTPIPKGFTEKTSQAPQAKTEEPKPVTTGDTGAEADKTEGGRDNGPDDSKSWAEKNYEALSADPVGFGMEQLKGGFMDKFGGVGAAMIGGPVLGGLTHSALQVENVAAATAARDYAKAKGLDTAELDTALKAAEENLPAGAKALQGIGIGTGQRYTKSLQEYEKVKKPSSGNDNLMGGGTSLGKDDNKDTEFGGFGSSDLSNVDTSSGSGGMGSGGGPGGNVKDEEDKTSGGGVGFKKGGLVTKKVKQNKNKGLVTRRK